MTYLIHSIHIINYVSYVIIFFFFCNTFDVDRFLQLKTVMERCEKGKPELLDRVRSMRTKNGGSGYVERLHQTAEKHFCVPLSSTALDSVDPKSQLTQAQLEKYSRAYDDSPHVSDLIYLHT